MKKYSFNLICQNGCMEKVTEEIKNQISALKKEVKAFYAIFSHENQPENKLNLSKKIISDLTKNRCFFIEEILLISLAFLEQQSQDDKQMSSYLAQLIKTNVVVRDYILDVFLNQKMVLVKQLTVNEVDAQSNNYDFKAEAERGIDSIRGLLADPTFVDTLFDACWKEQKKPLLLTQLSPSTFNYLLQNRPVVFWKILERMNDIQRHSLFSNISGQNLINGIAKLQSKIFKPTYLLNLFTILVKNSSSWSKLQSQQLFYLQKQEPVEAAEEPHSPEENLTLESDQKRVRAIVMELFKADEFTGKYRPEVETFLNKCPEVVSELCGRDDAFNLEILKDLIAHHSKPVVFVSTLAQEPSIKPNIQKFIVEILSQLLSKQNESSPTELNLLFADTEILKWLQSACEKDTTSKFTVESQFYTLLQHQQIADKLDFSAIYKQNTQVVWKFINDHDIAELKQQKHLIAEALKDPEHEFTVAEIVKFIEIDGSINEDFRLQLGLILSNPKNEKFLIELMQEQKGFVSENMVVRTGIFANETINLEVSKHPQSKEKSELKFSLLQQQANYGVQCDKIAGLTKKVLQLNPSLFSQILNDEKLRDTISLVDLLEFFATHSQYQQYLDECGEEALLKLKQVAAMDDELKQKLNIVTNKQQERFSAKSATKDKNGPDDDKPLPDKAVALKVFKEIWDQYYDAMQPALREVKKVDPSEPQKEVEIYSWTAIGPKDNGFIQEKVTPDDLSITEELSAETTGEIASLSIGPAISDEVGLDTTSFQIISAEECIVELPESVASSSTSSGSSLINAISMAVDVTKSTVLPALSETSTDILKASKPIFGQIIETFSAMMGQASEMVAAGATELAKNASELSRKTWHYYHDDIPTFISSELFKTSVKNLANGDDTKKTELFCLLNYLFGLNEKEITNYNSVFAQVNIDDGKAALLFDLLCLAKSNDVFYNYLQLLFTELKSKNKVLSSGDIQQIKNLLLINPSRSAKFLMYHSTFIQELVKDDDGEFLQKLVDNCDVTSETGICSKQDAAKIVLICKRFSSLPNFASSYFIRIAGYKGDEVFLANINRTSTTNELTATQDARPAFSSVLASAPLGAFNPPPPPPLPQLRNKNKTENSKPTTVIAEPALVESAAEVSKLENNPASFFSSSEDTPPKKRLSQEERRLENFKKKVHDKLCLVCSEESSAEIKKACLPRILKLEGKSLESWCEFIVETEAKFIQLVKEFNANRSKDNDEQEKLLVDKFTCVEGEFYAGFDVIYTVLAEDVKKGYSRTFIIKEIIKTYKSNYTSMPSQSSVANQPLQSGGIPSAEQLKLALTNMKNRNKVQGNDGAVPIKEEREQEPASASAVTPS